LLACFVIGKLAEDRQQGFNLVFRGVDNDHHD
jgi:hypothetical protein